MRYYLTGAKLLDGKSLYRSANVLTQDGMILRVDEAPNFPENAEVIDLTGYTLLPGFVDAHVHTSSALKEDGTYSDATLREITRKGVCLLKDMGCVNNAPLEPYMDWLRSVDTTEYAKVYTAGRYIDVSGGYGMGPSFGGPSPKWGIEVFSPEEAAEAVSYQHANGVSGIKIGISDGGMGPKEGEIPPEYIRAISERAKELGMWTTAHIYKAEDLRKIVDGGICEGGHTPKDRIPDELLEKMAALGVPLTTTVGPASSAGPGPGGPGGGLRIDETAKANLYDNLTRFHKMGGQVNVGSDSFLGAGGHGPRKFGIPVAELQHLSAMGLGLREVITCATRNGALSCGVHDHGYIAAGYQANLIAVPGELDETFEKLDAPAFVMNRGTILVKP